MDNDIKKNIIAAIKGLDRKTDDLIKYLENSDYFTAPASTKHHLARPGGLAEHSWSVYLTLKGINDTYKLELAEDSMTVIGLLHDLCKVFFYAREKKRVRTPAGEWIDQEVYVCKDGFPLGHGEKSVIMIQPLLMLYEHEIMAIRWHMGPWDAEGFGQRRDLNGAMSSPYGKYVKAIQLADMTSTWLVEKD